ncbi:MAG TPA: class I SAM-dependent methyltransferase [Chloroflexota bacterium]|nr:class I SAM-dependent methyltransferase [Chloroflexota bacterium]
MERAGPDHKQVVQHEFSQQAPQYAANPLISDPARIARLVRAVSPAPTARVLEVATGPGHVALGFAAVCREVVGIDLTAAPLALAERLRQERGLANARFALGDAEATGFADGAFDVVVCRYAFHHFADPPAVLREMTRVCRAGGTVALEDLVVSEQPARAAYQNRFEHLRDPSHTRAYPLSELLALLTANGLELEAVYSDALTQEVERWLANAHTLPERAAEARALIERDAREDLSGARPYRADGRLWFVQRTAALVGRKLAAPA